MQHYTADKENTEPVEHILPPVAVSQKDEKILRKQGIDKNGPGTILRDFEILLHMIGSEGVKVSPKTQQLTSQTLVELNSRLTNPIALDLKRFRQKSYPNIHGLYLILRSSGLGLVQQSKEWTSPRKRMLTQSDILLDCMG